MTKEEILEGNKLIAEFMGGTFKNISSKDIAVSWVSIHMKDDDVNFQEEDYPEKPHNGSCWKFNELKYHSSWDWLMPVVEKIEKTYAYVDIKGCAVNISTIVETSAPTKIEAVYMACVEFIEWYNNK